jgi:hypothetical protein
MPDFLYALNYKYKEARSLPLSLSIHKIIPAHPVPHKKNFCSLEVFSMHTMKAYGGTRRTPPLTRNLGTRWRWVVHLTSWPLYPRKRPQHPLNRGLGGGPHKRSKHFGEQKNLLPCRDSNPGPPNRCTDRAADGGFVLLSSRS